MLNLGSFEYQDTKLNKHYSVRFKAVENLCTQPSKPLWLVQALRAAALGGYSDGYKPALRKIAHKHIAFSTSLYLRQVVDSLPVL